MKVNIKKDQKIDYIKCIDHNKISDYRYSGKITSATLQYLKNIVLTRNNVSLIELDKLAEEFILKNGCTPTFKNYGAGSNGKSFPNSVCLSVYNIMVHGVATDYVLRKGDKISIDLGCTYNGAITDSAITVIIGNYPQLNKLNDACLEALNKGISAVKIGNKIGCIGSAIYKSAKGNGYNVITHYGGHGIDEKPHAEPFISNKASETDGCRIQPGMLLAIEPQLVFGSTDTYVSIDGWSVVSKGIASHWEHSIYVNPNGDIEVLTK